MLCGTQKHYSGMELGHTLLTGSNMRSLREMNTNEQLSFAQVARQS